MLTILQALLPVLFGFSFNSHNDPVVVDTIRGGTIFMPVLQIREQSLKG